MEKKNKFEIWKRIDFIYFATFKGQGGAVKRWS